MSQTNEDIGPAKLHGIPDRYPKLESPFVRDEIGGNYVATDQIKPKFSWVFDEAEDVTAVEKVNGEPVCILLDNNAVMRSWTREQNEIDPWNDYGERQYVHAVQESIGRGYLDDLDDGLHWGEAVGPGLGGGRHAESNPYDLDEHIYIPFAWAREKLEVESYGKYDVSYGAISSWFEDGLIPLFASMMHGESFDTASDRGRYVEGLVFYHPAFADDGLETGEVRYRDETRTVAKNVAKLRTDMFPFYHEICDGT